MCGKKYARGSKITKWSLIVAGLLFIILICIVVYWWILAPVISRLFISEKCIFHAVDYYITGEYLDFEDGVIFRAMLSEFGAFETGEIVDFYYVDNYIEDNLIYGKMCDIYALDVVYQENVYFNKKQEIGNDIEEAHIIGDYTLFSVVDNSEERSFVKGVAFCDETYTLRYILITDLDTTFLISNVFSRHSNLDWEE